jgi:hypothetical protein
MSLCVVPLTVAQIPPLSTPLSPEVSIVVHDYADVSSAPLRAAEDRAREIFWQAGLKTVWLNCSSKLEERKLEPEGCYMADTSHLTLKILPQAVNANIRNHLEVLGTAYPDEKGVGLFAYVFYDRVQELAQRRNLGHALLAAVMAHEIGHLLLGSNSHSVGGIMSAQWSDTELRKVSQGSMSFVPDESRIMRNRLRSRPNGQSVLARSDDEL